MNELIKENERVDDLQFRNYKIIQRNDGFCFGIDSVLLSDFAKKIKNGSSVLDLGTGTGILGILLCGKTKLKSIIGVEIQKEIADMASRSIKLNNLDDRFSIVNCNIKDLDKYLKFDSYDAIVTNPPYKKIDSGKVNENEIKLLSRHEIEANLSDFIRVSFKFLKDKGTLFMVHRAERLADIVYEMRSNRIEPKRIRFVYSNETSGSKLVLIEGVKNGNAYVEVEKPLYVYKENGDYTDEIYQIYGKNKELLENN